MLYDDARKGLYFAAATGESAPVQAGTLFTSGESLVVDALESDPEHYKTVDQQTQRTTNSMVCVALTFANERIGVVQILNKRTGNYTERDRVLLENFASQASIAIRNARLFEDLLAHMGLYGSQAAIDLVSELNRPARSEKLTLLFADMRGFTQLCQVLTSPERIQNLLDEFLGMLAEQVTQYDGIVNKFLGDGLLALFRKDNSAKRAVKCAFGMMQRQLASILT